MDAVRYRRLSSRSSDRISGALLIVGLILIAVLVVLNIRVDRRLGEAQQRNAERSALIKEVTNDPIVQAITHRGDEQCTGQTSDFLWACGYLIELPIQTDGIKRFCSSPDAPRYIGSLSADTGGRFWTWSGDAAFAFDGLTDCPSLGSDCPYFTVSGTESTGPWGRPPSAPPAALPDDPDRSRLKPGGKRGAVRTWATFEGQPVAFFAGYQRRDDPVRGCALATRHPRLPLDIRLRIPCDRYQDWRRALGRVVAHLDAGVRRSRPAACHEPPPGVRLRIGGPAPAKIALDWYRRTERQAGE